MKHLIILTLLAAVCIFFAASWLSKPKSAAPATQPGAVYICPMASDADVISDKPGQCPKCGMDLVLKK